MKFKDYLNEELEKPKLPTKLSVKFQSANPGNIGFNYVIPEIGVHLDYEYKPNKNDNNFPEDVFNGVMMVQVSSYGKTNELDTFVKEYLNKHADSAMKDIAKKIQSHDILVLSQYRKPHYKRRKINEPNVTGPYKYAVTKEWATKVYKEYNEDNGLGMPYFGNKKGHDRDSQLYINDLIKQYIEEFVKANGKDLIKAINDAGLFDLVRPLKGIRAAKI